VSEAIRDNINHQTPITLHQTSPPPPNFNTNCTKFA